MNRYEREAMIAEGWNAYKDIVNMFEVLRRLSIIDQDTNFTIINNITVSVEIE